MHFHTFGTNVDLEFYFLKCKKVTLHRTYYLFLCCILPVLEHVDSLRNCSSNLLRKGMQHLNQSYYYVPVVLGSL